MRLRENFTGRATLCGASLELEFRIGAWRLMELGLWELGFALGDPIFRAN